MDPPGGAAPHLHECEEEQRERNVFGEVAVHSDRTRQGSVAPGADGDARALARTNDPQGEEDVDERCSAYIKDTWNQLHYID